MLLKIDSGSYFFAAEMRNVPLGGQLLDFIVHVSSSSIGSPQYDIAVKYDSAVVISLAAADIIQRVKLPSPVRHK